MTDTIHDYIPTNEFVVTVVNNRYAAVTGANTTVTSMKTYLELGSNNIVRLHSVLLSSRLNRMRRDDDDDEDDDEGQLRPHIRSSLLAALSSLPLRDVVSSSSLSAHSKIGL